MEVKVDWENALPMQAANTRNSAVILFMETGFVPVNKQTISRIFNSNKQAPEAHPLTFKP